MGSRGMTSGLHSSQMSISTSTTNTNTVQPHAVLGPQTQSTTDGFQAVIDARNGLQLANTINPNRRKAHAYRINCQRCVTAVEAQFRGYDVTAKGNRGDWKGINELLVYPSRYNPTYDPNDYIVPNRTNYKGFPTDVYFDSTIMGRSKNTNGKGVADTAARGADALTRQIEAKMKSWGDNSRGVLSITWTTGGAHTINIVNTKQGPKIIDGQTGHIIVGHNKLVNYFRHTVCTQTGLVRTDNKSLRTDSATRLNRVVKTRTP